MEETNLFSDPDDFYPESPKPTFQTFSYGSISLQMRNLGTTALWGHVVSNAARYLCNKIFNKTFDCNNKTIVELGSGSGLVGLFAGICGATVCFTDYPEPKVLENIRFNCQSNGFSKFFIQPLIWGNPVEDVIQSLGGTPDIIICSDLVFNHSCHESLASTISSLLGPSSVAIFAFSHHRPCYVQQDLQFFEVCSSQGLFVEHFETDTSFEPLFEDESKYAGNEAVRGPVHCYLLKKT
ncbi:hypothetical protein P9112_012523 [Eukaryota sp. TZLM1-RC]